MKARSILLLGLSILWTTGGVGQTVVPSRIEWQKTYGGESTEQRPRLARSSDGGFFLGGQSLSGISGSKGTTNFGGFDLWLLKLNASGDKIWEADFGGDSEDELAAVCGTADGGCVLAGSSIYGISGNRTAPGFGSWDLWVVRVDANGNKLWDKSFGGRGSDLAETVLQTSDGGFLVTGRSDSGVGGNKTTPNLGGPDCWVLRLDAQGDKLWERVYGGTGDESFHDARQTSDGGFILCGYSSSGAGSGKSSPNYGNYDIWLVRIDADGNRLWDRSYGGDGEDHGRRVVVTADGRFLVGASTMSGISGNKESPFYGGIAEWGDYWVLLLDAAGNKLWERDFGGSGPDELTDAAQSPDGAFYIAGSTGGTNHHLWLVRLDQAGNPIWDHGYDHGTNVFFDAHVQLTADGGLLVAGALYSTGDSHSGDLTVLKLGADALTAQTVAPSRIEWFKTFMATNEDREPRLERMRDGGYVMGCTSSSGISGDKTSTSYGASDFWVLRLDGTGNKLWEADFGGTNSETLGDLKPTLDGGVILIGESFSPPSGNKTAPLLGGSDFWVVRLDATGNKVWDASFGGADSEKARAVEALDDGGFLVAGTRKSLSAGVVSSFFWIVRLDAQGEELWNHSYTNGYNLLTDMHKTSDGGFVLAGESGDDVWIVRIDGVGDKVWDRTFGGAGNERECRVQVLEDGGLIVGALTTSGISGNKTTTLQGNEDYWVLRLDTDGNKIWEQDFGGTLLDYFSDVQQTLDGGFIVAGFGYSDADGNKRAPRRGDSYDLWLVRLDKEGRKVWDESYDGIHRLGTPRLQPSGDGGFVIAASFNTFTNILIQDLIIVKLSADALSAPQLRFPTVSPGGNGFRFQLSGISNRTYVTEFSADMASWAPLATNRVAGEAVDLWDAGASGTKRFYRARMVD